MQRDILHNLLLLMHIPLRHRHILLRLKIKLRSVRIRTTHAFHGTSIGFDVDDVAEADAFLLDGFVDAGI